MLIRIDRETGRTESARAHVETLLRQFPGDPSTLFLLADIQIAERKYEAAEATMRHLLGIRRSPPILNGLAWILWRRGRPEEALPLAREAVEAAPNAGSVHDTLAGILYALGRREEAATAIADAERLSPHDPAIRDHAVAIRAGRPIP
jgi:Flp pilus assembly protein TadD